MKISFYELCEALRNDHQKKGVIVIANGPYWTKEYDLLSRAYYVSGECKWFNPDMMGNSIFGYSLDHTDQGVRIDCYLKDNECPWQIEYCYLLDDDFDYDNIK